MPSKEQMAERLGNSQLSLGKGQPPFTGLAVDVDLLDQSQRRFLSSLRQVCP